MALVIGGVPLDTPEGKRKLRNLLRRIERKVKQGKQAKAKRRRRRS
jgi:hypothetical protein